VSLKESDLERAVDCYNSILYQAAGVQCAPSTSLVAAERCCMSGYQKEEMGQYHPDHS